MAVDLAKLSLWLVTLAKGRPFGFLDRVHAYCRMHEGNTSHDELRMHHGKWQVASRFAAEHERELKRRGIAAAPALAYHEADYGKALIANGFAVTGFGDVLAVPDLTNWQWIDHQDVRFELAREFDRYYPMQSLTEGNGTLDTDVGFTQTIDSNQAAPP